MRTLFSSALLLGLVACSSSNEAGPDPSSAGNAGATSGGIAGSAGAAVGTAGAAGKAGAAGGAAGKSGAAGGGGKAGSGGQGQSGQGLGGAAGKSGSGTGGTNSAGKSGSGTGGTNSAGKSGSGTGGTNGAGQGGSSGAGAAGSAGKGQSGGGGTAGASGSTAAAGSAGSGAGGGATSGGCATGLAAFPGAEGFGACAKGGRGGKVIAVTTLALKGPGSIQAALDAPGPRTIVFTVSGVIQGVPIATHGDFTIAGQTSPGGITLRGLLIQGDIVCEAPGPPDCPQPTTTPSNFVVRHVRLRPGTIGDPDGAGDGLRLHHATNGIIDHVSVGNAEDEAIQISFTSDLSIQYTMLAETIGSHYEFGGMLINYSDPARGFPLTRLSIHHTMWTRLFGRMPEVSRENVPDDQPMDLEVSNVVLYGNERPMYVASHNPLATPPPPLHYHLNYVGNYSAQRPIPQCYGLVAVEGGPDATKPSFTPSSSIFFADDRTNKTTRTDYELIYNDNDYCDADKTNGLPYGNDAATRPGVARSTRHDFPPISLMPSGKGLIDHLVANAGAFPRDPMDKRLMSDPAAGTFASAPVWQNPANDALLPALANPPAAPVDTDGDGMPDAWETAHGLDPKNAVDGGDTGTSLDVLGVPGYTNLEAYLEELSQARIKKG